MKAHQIDRGPVALYPQEQAGVGAPLLHAAWLFAVGIGIAHYIWLRPAWLLLSIVPVAILCSLAAIRAQRLIWLPVGVLWLILGVWYAEMQPQPAPQPALAVLSNGLMRTVEGTVIDAGPVRNEPLTESGEMPAEGPSQRLDVRVSSVEFVSDTEDVQVPGDGIVRMNVRWPSDAAAPAGFGYKDYLVDQGITSTASVKANRVEPIISAGEKTFACRISAWQHAASARLLALPVAMHGLPAALRLSDDDAIMLAAMVTGDRTYLTHSVREGFERTGSFHMLVVSGLHLGIVAGCVLWISRRVGLAQLPASLITIAASFAYALFTGFATPVQRSLWMVSLYLIGRLVYRQRNVLNTIGFASLCLLAASPRSLFESSLQTASNRSPDSRFPDQTSTLAAK